MSDQSSFNPELILKTLAEHEVSYVLIGALAARLQGFPRMTADADITPATNTENLKNLAKALKKLDARVFTESVPKGLAFECTAENLVQSQLWNFVTSAGRLDVVFEPIGTSGYEDLMENSVEFEVFDVHLYAAGLEDIIRSKKAADRLQDRQDIIILREILKRRSDN